MPIKNNVTRLLDSRQIAYTTAEYDGSQFHSAIRSRGSSACGRSALQDIVVLREDKAASAAGDGGC